MGEPPYRAPLPPKPIELDPYLVAWGDLRWRQAVDRHLGQILGAVALVNVLADTVIGHYLLSLPWLAALFLVIGVLSRVLVRSPASFRCPACGARSWRWRPLKEHCSGCGIQIGTPRPAKSAKPASH